MKGCELCGNAARMYCEADQASLCWGCDEKVHCANFLVARHSRSLLCHVCQSPTTWNASGPKLTLTVSVCDGCVESHRRPICNGEDEAVVLSDDGGHDDDDEDEGDYSFGEYEDEDEDEDEGEDEDENEDGEGENQVVPWSSTSSEPPPPPASSSGSEEDEEEPSTAISTLKRTREHTDLDSDDEIGCSSSIMASGALASEEASYSGSTRATKQRRIADANKPERLPEESRSTAIISSLRRLQNDRIVDDDDAAATVLGICKLSRDHSR
ncbi:zinc finger protein CONSTANS-like isoform X2 [Alnus glutinosa]|uniref:zinc finger protein CONSTANS-like isoform X2 n=1 Tax=Alnus glutinosa TaxID=3517 RepID=UPI002D77F948|nr:zinc finger protein CONSTANS-like isoform X2 [Alnus glutinosa]